MDYFYRCHHKIKKYFGRTPVRITVMKSITFYNCYKPFDWLIMLEDMDATSTYSQCWLTLFFVEWKGICFVTRTRWHSNVLRITMFIFSNSLNLPIFVFLVHVNNEMVHNTIFPIFIFFMMFIDCHKNRSWATPQCVSEKVRLQLIRSPELALSQDNLNIKISLLFLVIKNLSKHDNQ